jgi:hypothetical protein
MTRKIQVIIFATVCIALALVYISVTYVHLGYIGVIDTADGPRLLDRGLHLRPPLKSVTFYPVQSREIHLRTIDEGVHGRIEFDVVLLLSVSRDRVVHLHETYGGDYMERLVSPLVVEHFRIRGDGSGDWGDGIGSEKAAEGIVERIISEAAPHGVNIMGAWIRSFEVSLTE